jgi:hypothetical protein
MVQAVHGVDFTIAAGVGDLHRFKPAAGVSYRRGVAGAALGTLVNRAGAPRTGKRREEIAFSPSRTRDFLQAFAVRCPPVPDRDGFGASLGNHPRSISFANAFNAELQRGGTMNDIIYLVGVIVVIMAVLSLVGLR